MKQPFCVRRLRPTRGFTLIETMVVVAIMAILLAVAVPSMSALLDRNALADNVNEFVGAINVARTEAIKRGVTVVMCRSTTADAATGPACATGAAWETGWIVFADFDGDGAFSAAAGDVLLRTQASLARGGSISQTQTSLVSLQFGAVGLLRSGSSTFTFLPSSGSTSLQRQAIVGFGGRVRLVSGISE